MEHLLITEYAWICPNKQEFEYASGPKYAKILSMAKFWIWQGYQILSVTQGSKHAKICFDRVLNISQVLKMPEFWVWQGSEYERVTQGSKYATTWFNMSEQNVNMPEYALFYVNKQGSEYVS